MARDKETFDRVYGYNHGMDYTYPSFKLLYNSKDFAQHNDYKRIQLCLIDFLVGLKCLSFTNRTEELKYMVDSVFSPGLKNFIEKKCTLFESQNNPALGKEIEYGTNIENRHLFYKVKFSPKFVIELEGYKPQRLDEMTQNKGLINFFKDEDLNQIIEKLNFNPDFISIFSLKQIEYGVGDVIFKGMFEEFKKKIEIERVAHALKSIKKK
jgi:hypothetical protein